MPATAARRRARRSIRVPDDPVYAFAPFYEFEDEVQQIRIVFEDIPVYIPTAMVALTLEDAENLRDRLNRRLGLDRNARTAKVAASIRPGDEDPESSAWH